MADLTWLRERMTSAGSTPAIVRDDRVATYDQLLHQIDAAHTTLRENSVGAGQTVALVGDFDLPTSAMLLALIESDVIVTPLTQKVAKESPEFLDVSEAQVVIRTMLDVPPEVERYADRVVENPLNLRLKKAGTPGLVLYTSGSTGASKGAIHDFTRILEKFKKRRPSLCTLSFLLLDHIGGQNTLLHTLANGGTVVAVSDRRPSSVCSVIAKQQVELLPVSPAFLNLLLLSGEVERHDLSSLKVISYGTEPMPESTLLRLADVLPGVKLQQTYGLTEVGILRSQSRDNRSLWVRVGGEGYETKVVDDVLWIRAHSSMLGYLNAPSPFDADGWLCTGDLVEVDGEYLRILGRKGEVINVGGVKVHPAEVESAILSLPNVRDAVVYGEANPLTGQMVVAEINTVNPESKLDLKKRVRNALRQSLPAYKVPQKVVVTDAVVFNDRFKRLRVNRSSRKHAADDTVDRP